jgi:glutathione S-transferase
MSLELVSFILCPFVQRAVITLKEKGVAYDVTYIDLDNPPDWFKNISPFGKVPLLKTEGEVLFESAIINEYLDETFPPSLHPDSPLIRAKHRGWVEFGSSLLFDQFKLIMAKDEDERQQQMESLGGSFARLSDAKGDGRYFSGDSFSLVDAAFAPLFMRFDILKKYLPELEGLMPSKLQVWARELALRPSVSDSVVSDFEPRFVEFFRQKGTDFFDLDSTR